jgi:hypothetical protein
MLGAAAFAIGSVGIGARKDFLGAKDFKNLKNV